MRITGIVSIQGENGVAGLHIHQGKDAANAATIGDHLFREGSSDPWLSSTVNLVNGVGEVNINTADLVRDSIP